MIRILSVTTTSYQPTFVSKLHQSNARGMKHRSSLMSVNSQIHRLEKNSLIFVGNLIIMIDVIGDGPISEILYLKQRRNKLAIRM